MSGRILGPACGSAVCVGAMYGILIILVVLMRGSEKCRICVFTRREGKASSFLGEMYSPIKKYKNVA